MESLRKRIEKLPQDSWGYMRKEHILTELQKTIAGFEKERRRCYDNWRMLKEADEHRGEQFKNRFKMAVLKEVIEALDSEEGTD